MIKLTNQIKSRSLHKFAKILLVPSNKPLALPLALLKLTKRQKSSRVKNSITNVELIGPNPSVYSKIKRKYRWHIVMKYIPNDEKLIRKLLKSTLIKKRDEIRVGEVAISIDINTSNTL